MPISRRFKLLEEREVNRETFVEPWPEAGLIVADSPADPQPGLRIEAGRVIELDGRLRAKFDILDYFIADNGLDLAAAEIAMATPSIDIARKLVDINVPRAEILYLASGCTPAKLVDIIRHMNVLEMMVGLGKMRARRTPANQAHVTNLREHPALLAADAAEAALRGFAEVETTVGVARYAPFSALAILIGSQTGRGGVLTQCAVEESLGLELAMKGLTSYAETLSVYGTEGTFVDGDDTPWSKAFLSAAYASRGVKIRFTSGTGSEALMGHAEGCSMLYLEARCLFVTRGAGSQGVQNGSISCIALPESLPGGVRAVLAENLLATMLGLEVASGNDALASHSDIRKAAKLMLQFIPGTDFITSGYSAMPRRENLFGGGNFDAADFDDYNVLQRDMQVDGGITPISEDEALSVRREAASAIQAVYAELGFPGITDAEVEAAVLAHGSETMPERDVIADLAAADKFLPSQQTILTVIRALQTRGFEQVASNLLEMARQRVAGDYLQTSAIFDSNFKVQSAVNDANTYTGPGTGYRMSAERWQEIQNLPQVKSPRDFIADQIGEPCLRLAELSPAEAGNNSEVIVAVGPAFGTELTRTINGLDHEEVLAAILTGVASQGLVARVVKVYRTSDCAAIGQIGAQLSGSGIAIGLQSRGTTIIHKRGLARLNNLELFSQSPNLTLETYQAIGVNAARYAMGKATAPVPVQVDNWARLRLIVKTALLHRHETGEIQDQPPMEMRFDWEPDL
ncbi:MAG: propanediol/glycerol family dehydratase large subunit [Anaerolineales bacterium]|uniref:Propanediol/glycerol family dehydratase large subunit n=1 Tax=Candidatus Desulfolinea nitratireducens TaxID=2841698 RepID=A0A8J6TIV3_9CHLR|nr:propanediol/glycerol family dehydratase large subunit [Candidatus Desulfolinea nitratireducens]